jgi:hypothetical protein
MYLLFDLLIMDGVSDIFMSAFQMELNNYPHFNLTKDGTLGSTGQHCPGFLRVLYDALICLGYDGTLQSTVVDCPWPMASTSARSA